MTSTNDDWRLAGPVDQLRGLTLRRKKYTKYREGWDHDHCSFCGAKFAEIEGDDVLHEGYSTPDDYDWICDTCFSDFQELFKWEVAN